MRAQVAQAGPGWLRADVLSEREFSIVCAALRLPAFGRPRRDSALLSAVIHGEVLLRRFATLNSPWLIATAPVTASFDHALSPCLCLWAPFEEQSTVPLLPHYTFPLRQAFLTFFLARARHSCFRHLLYLSAFAFREALPSARLGLLASPTSSIASRHRLSATRITRPESCDTMANQPAPDINSILRLLGGVCCT